MLLGSKLKNEPCLWTAPCRDPVIKKIMLCIPPLFHCRPPVPNEHPLAVTPHEHGDRTAVSCPSPGGLLKGLSMTHGHSARQLQLLCEL